MLQPPDPAPSIASLSRVTTLGRAGTPALHDVSFTLPRGEILTLLGSGGNASGTGTILALVAGFTRATSGQVQIGGRMMDATPTHQRNIGMVGRRLSLFPHLTVMGHARFAPGVRPAQADAILQRLDLSAFARRLPSTLTPEGQFRVALARALSYNPKLLLVEDPPASFQAMKPLIRALVAETGLSVLHTTDDVQATYGFSDRVAVFQAGMLRQIGTPQELYDRPETLAVAQAMGPLNKLAGTVIDIEDDIARIRLAGGAVVEARFGEGAATSEMLKPGEACVVTLRPERIAVASVVAAEMGEGAVPAKLVETVFEGAQLRLRFSLDSRHGAAPEVMVTRPSGAILPRGNAMCLAWQPHHAHAFRTESA